jgi:hypothetical protein
MCRVSTPSCAARSHLRGGTVSIKRKLRALLLCLPLLLGSMVGAPMRPDEIEELMQAMNQQKIAYTTRDESENGDGTMKCPPAQYLD